ncbi:hypothetical protein RS130_22670 [Paraglaciecola aquimarina]|uniref:Uncharacterized protein n=1 Tax=Paraglaciecola aquimarina TaxID=1235557 RepID=A0ABU3T222_9ALTE|nr:hypothetical protein [Paraglaciecola aquimarina]MDU0356317.1 hypothetical protein [Paraglaciecola aquimarina]
MVTSSNTQLFLSKMHSAKKALMGFVILTLNCQLSFNALALTDGTWAKVDTASVEQSARYTKRGVGYYTYNNLVLADSSSVTGALRLVITDSSHTVLEPDGIDENARPYFDVEALTDATQIYFAAKRGAFTYTAELQEYLEPDVNPNAVTFSYDFNQDQIQTENNNWEGWVYPAKNRGVVSFAEGAGEDDSNAYVYEDTSTNSNISQNGIRFNNRTNKDNINPWTSILADAHGKTLGSVSLWAKVEKAVPGDVTVQHHLIPYPVIDDKKGATLTAGIDIGPQYEMVIPASLNNTWVQIEFIDSNTGKPDFTIPQSWVHYDGESDIQVYPEILFGGLEVGDKVTVDSYLISDTTLENPCCVIVDGGDTGSGGDGGNSGGGNEPDYTLGDELTFDYTFDLNDIASGQGS